jgi:hypothetical protein
VSVAGGLHRPNSCETIERSERAGRGGKLTGKEAVVLDEELQVHIVALGRLTVRLAHVVRIEIDACLGEETIVSLLT